MATTNTTTTTTPTPTASPSPSVSHASITESIATDHVPPTAFVPNDGNLFPKWPSKLDKASWDQWQVQCMAADGSAGVVIIFFRCTAHAPHGFRVMVNASWASPAGNDGEEEKNKETVWNGDFKAPHSIVTADPAGGVTGVWRGNDADGPPAFRFEVAADLSRAVVTLDVPGKVVGTVALTALADFDNALPQTEAEVKFTPSFWWVRPIVMAGVTADLTFFPHSEDQKAAPGNDISSHFPEAGKRLQLSEDGEGGHGAFGTMERGWSTLPTGKCLSLNWWVWGRAGPYVIQVLWALGRPEEARALWASARLYRDGQLVCAPQKAVEADAPQEDGTDTLTMEGLYDDEGKGGDRIAAPYRIKNIGHRIVFRSGRKAGEERTWVFETRHVRPWWNYALSAPGPSSSGLSTFVLSVSGGPTSSAETFQGPGIVGGGIFPS
ncbi:hypothetical protein QBC33DRAFT_604001 [Phialemonium atrogriseum]|uniref:AttH domain-containing protein n=1 Tax=Phialemonium atrogriseum TaxID=1093897 RepID=A0AAJ0BPD6_9PEZI|nr:uncharacterized protein QBC33DRAFT_604001 [Phialemonium atrogriseum]KAK1761740.1 hypothetical protein QBC33DRAFT_604001 [Phialemonium atrogriseum]